MKKMIVREENFIETNYCFFELPSIFGCDFICQTSGDPITGEDDGADFIYKLIDNADAADIMEADDNDYAYVMSLAEAWGII